jgi:hypothetical protein
MKHSLRCCSQLSYGQVLAFSSQHTSKLIAAKSSVTLPRLGVSSMYQWVSVAERTIPHHHIES